MELEGRKRRGFSLLPDFDRVGGSGENGIVTMMRDGTGREVRLALFLTGEGDQTHLNPDLPSKVWSG